MGTTKQITGRVDDKSITRFIENYQSNIFEQVLTLKREILEEFERLGYNKKMVEFDDE